jgi:phosphopantetheinyl transferase (holo-ACP synthase)
MPSEIEYCYHFRDGSAVLVKSYVNNVWAAKKAMLKMYGRDESEIRYSDSGKNGPHQVFDGRDYH